MSNNVFFDERLNDELDKKGFVIINFLDDVQLAELSEFYRQIHQNRQAPFTSFMSEDLDYKLRIDAFIKSGFSKPAEKIFKRHQPYWGNFFTKYPAQPQMPLHADLQYVDEADDISLNIWCPLSATNQHNATLGVVPYSHKLMKQHRGINIIDAYKERADAIAEKYVALLEFKAGEAIVYDQRLLHLSSANETDTTRVAATLVMTPKGKDVFQFFAENEGDTTFYKYKINAVEEVIKTPFKKMPAHLTPAEVITNYEFRPLTETDVQLYLNEVNELEKV